MNDVKLSVIISTYKRIDYLDLVLKSLDKQTFKNFEVIIAEDNNAKEMEKFIFNKKEQYNFIIKHVSQPDLGFRKGKILNEAIKVSENNFLVFIDSDVILHSKFLEHYAKNKIEKICLFGRRVMLDEKTTDRLLETKKIDNLSFFKLLKTNSRHLEEGIYFPFKPGFLDKKVIIGCSFGVSKSDMYQINGFDEDYTDYTFGTDTDVKWRLEKINVKFKSLRNKAIQYHLFHGRNKREDIHKRQKKFYQQKKEAGKYFCESGLKKVKDN